MIDNAALGLVAFALLIVWSVQIAKLAARRRRVVLGKAAKFRYSLPALAAWCWPAVIACEAAFPKFPPVVGWLMPFMAPLAGALLAQADRPPVDYREPTVLQTIVPQRSAIFLTWPDDATRMLSAWD